MLPGPASSAEKQEGGGHHCLRQGMFKLCPLSAPPPHLGLSESLLEDLSVRTAHLPTSRSRRNQYVGTSRSLVAKEIGSEEFGVADIWAESSGAQFWR